MITYRVYKYQYGSKPYHLQDVQSGINHLPSPFLSAFIPSIYTTPFHLSPRLHVQSSINTANPIYTTRPMIYSLNPNTPASKPSSTPHSPSHTPQPYSDSSTTSPTTISPSLSSPSASLADWLTNSAQIHIYQCPAFRS